MKEIWKDIPDWEGLYQASNLGRIKNPNTGYVLKSYVCAKGYNTITLTNKNKGAHTYRVARVIAKLFIPNPENKPQVNHIDAIKVNDKAENLEWVTAKENAQHAHRMGLIKLPNTKPVVLIKDGEETWFKSRADANRFLGNKGAGRMYAALREGHRIRGYEIREGEDRSYGN